MLMALSIAAKQSAGVSFIKPFSSQSNTKELTIVGSFLLILFLFLPTQSLAKTNNYLGLSAYLTNSLFSEKDSQKALNTEQGQFTGLGLDWGYVITGNWLISGKITQQNTELNYQGFSQNGVAINSHTQYQQQEFSVAVRYTYQLYFASIGMSHNQHQRDIKSVGEISGLNETYQFNFVTVAAGWQHNLTQRLHFELSANYGYSAKSSLKAGFLNLYDTSKNDLNKVIRYQLSTQFAYTLSKSQLLLLAVQHQQTNISQSDLFVLTEQGKHKGFFYQPQRKLHQNTIVFSYRLNWR